MSTTSKAPSALMTLMDKLSYQFNEPSLLTQALSHKSFSSQSYERLEFLGDSLLNFIIGEALYCQFPSLKEGELSQLRAKMVKGKTLTEIAQEYQLGDFLYLGTGELKSGGKHRSSILADVVESIIGAIYMDSGMDACKKFVLEIYRQRLLNIDPSTSSKDAKTRLQEFLQAQKLPLPVYELIDSRGKDHQQVFTVACKIHQVTESFTAEGTSRRKAEQQTAEIALQYLQENS